MASPSSFANVCEIMSLHYTPREGLERFLGKLESNDPVHIILLKSEIFVQNSVGFLAKFI